MKKLAFIILTLSLTLVSCSKEDSMTEETTLTEAEIPVEIKSYIIDHFPSNSINSAEKNTVQNETFYTVFLSGNLNLEFNSQFDITDIDAETELPDSVVPQPIRDYVSQNYPNNFITDWEIEDGYQEVELDNGIELEFTLDGIFIRMDDNNDDDDDNEIVLTASEIPAEISTYITTHFPDSSIIRAIKETDDNIISYEVYLSDNFELTFNSDFEIIEIEGDTQLPNSVIPQAILDYVAQNYATNFITDWELKTNYQEIELNNGLELEFTLEGVFIRVDEDNNDGDENEVVLTENEIPTEIRTYVTTHFPNSTIVRAIKETDENVITYELYLSENVELTFNNTFQIIEIDGTTQLPDSVIPTAILDYVAQNYPNNFITNWELEDNHQQVELNDETELEFTLDGVFIRVDND